MLEISVDTMAVDAEAPPQEALEDGARPLVHCQVVGGMDLPLINPQTGRPLRFPSLVVNYGLTKKTALEWAEKLKSEADKLPDAPTSSIVTASNMSQVEEVAKLDQKLRT